MRSNSVRCVVNSPGYFGHLPTYALSAVIYESMVVLLMELNANLHGGCWPCRSRHLHLTDQISCHNKLSNIDSLLLATLENKIQRIINGLHVTLIFYQSTSCVMHD